MKHLAIFLNLWLGIQTAPADDFPSGKLGEYPDSQTNFPPRTLSKDKNTLETLYLSRFYARDPQSAPTQTSIKREKGNRCKNSHQPHSPAGFVAKRRRRKTPGRHHLFTASPGFTASPPHRIITGQAVKRSKSGKSSSDHALQRSFGHCPSSIVFPTVVRDP